MAVPLQEMLRKQPEPASQGAIERHLRLFSRNLPARVKLGEILRSLGPTDEQDCLVLVGADLMIAFNLAQRPGRWQIAIPETEAADACRSLLGDAVKVMKGGKISARDKAYDVVVVLDLLERVESDLDFIVECHRVLKPSGRLALSVPHVKNWSLLQPLVAAIGQSFQRRGLRRAGYSEPDLFHTLKDGFDVFHMHSFSRFCVELVRLLLAPRLEQTPEAEPTESQIRTGVWAYPVFWVADLLDLLIFFTRGYHLLAVAKRRAWLPRKTPILSDGRSITEAVLSRIKN